MEARSEARIKGAGNWKAVDYFPFMSVVFDYGKEANSAPGFILTALGLLVDLKIFNCRNMFTYKSLCKMHNHQHDQPG